MAKVLVTGGSGFIAVHILDLLFQKGYSVITTVRSAAKGEYLKSKFPGKPLEYAIVPDIAIEGAFDEVAKTPNLEYVLHTASPFHFNAKDPLQLINPAVTGTTSILKAIIASAPTVRHVVITSSFASILNTAAPNSTSHFTEASWNPSTLEDAYKGPGLAYRTSKVLAERAAWKTVQEAGNPFALTTVCPPMVFGPVAQKLESFENVNTSNAFMVKLLGGEWKERIPDTTQGYSWVDVRDVAKAHVLALEKEEAKEQRLFTIKGFYSWREIAKIVYDNFPEKRDKVPGPEVEGGELVKDVYSWNNDKTREILGMEWYPLETTIKDLAQSLIDLEKTLTK